MSISQQWTTKHGAMITLTAEQMRQAELIALAYMKRVHGSSKNRIELDDLRQEAYIGLIKAATRFNPNKGAKFSTFAQHWIEGSVRDYLRSMDPAGRTLRKRIRAGKTDDIEFVDINDPDLPQPAVAANQQQLAEAAELRSKVSLLPQAEAILVMHVYLEENYAADLVIPGRGSTKGNLSHIKKAALRRLREMYE